MNHKKRRINIWQRSSSVPRLQKTMGSRAEKVRAIAEGETLKPYNELGLSVAASGILGSAMISSTIGDIRAAALGCFVGAIAWGLFRWKK